MDKIVFIEHPPTPRLKNIHSFAFYDTAEYLSADRGANPQLEIESPREGLWYISVKCLTTVTVEETDYGQEYSGDTWVLNGVPYSLSVSWE